LKNTRPNILITLVDLHFGGISNLVLQTAPALNERMNIFVVYFGPNEDMLERYLNAGIRIERLNYEGKKDILSAVLKLRKFIIKNKIDLVSTNFTPDKIIVSLARLLTKFRVLGTIHNAQDRTGEQMVVTWGSRFEEFFNNYIADKIIGVSSAAIRVAKTFKNLNNKNSVVVHSGIEGFSDVSIKRKVKGETTIFITACRFHPVKGLSRLLQIFEKLKKLNINWEFWLIGDGVLLNELKNEVDGLGLTNNVKFMGFQHQLRPYYEASNFYINSSHHEALGVSLLEAMSIGLPIIGSDVGGIPEIIKDRENGFLVDFNNINSTLNILTYAIDMSGLEYEQFSANCIDTFHSKFSIEHYVEKMNYEVKSLI